MRIDRIVYAKCSGLTNYLVLRLMLMGQRVPSEACLEKVSPRVVERAGGAVELIQKSIDEGKELAANALGQEAVIADVTEIAVWNMSDEPSEEVENG